MQLNRGVRSTLVVLSLVPMSACKDLIPTATSAKSGVKTYESVWINANWGGSAKGAAEKTTSVTPNNIPSSFCPANSMILSNHGTTYKSVFSNSESVLVFKNTCNAPAELLVCITYPGPDGSEFPACNEDPRTTPYNRLASVSMGPFSSGIESTTWRETKISLHLNVFYCGVGDSFAYGIVPGSKPTDCIKQ